jgi:hypothetical protein
VVLFVGLSRVFGDNPMTSPPRFVVLFAAFLAVVPEVRTAEPKSDANEQSVPTALQLELASRNLAVQIDAVISISRRPYSSDAVQTLLDYLSTTDTISGRTEALDALLALGAAGKHVISFCRERMSDSDERVEVRLHAAGYLVTVCENENAASSYLLSVLKRPNSRLQDVTLEVVAKIGPKGKQFVPALLDALRAFGNNDGLA